MKCLYMSGCPQFSRQHLVEMLQNLTALETVDVTDCQQLDFKSIFELLEVLNHIKIFHFDPLDILDDRFKWRQLVKNQYHKVEFSPSVMRNFPVLNINRRMKSGFCEE